MDEFLANIIQQAPNVVVAVVVLYWMSKTIERLLANQEKLIDKLLEYVDETKEVNL